MTADSGATSSTYSHGSAGPHGLHVPFAVHLRLPAFTPHEGSARFEMVVEEIHLRHGGVMHGGVVAALLDTVMGHAAYSLAPKGHAAMTMQLNLNLTGTAKLGDRIVAEATPVNANRRMAVMNGTLRREDGKLLAIGSATMMYLQEGVRS